MKFSQIVENSRVLVCRHFPFISVVYRSFPLFSVSIAHGLHTDCTCTNVLTSASSLMYEFLPIYIAIKKPPCKGASGQYVYPPILA